MKRILFLSFVKYSSIHDSDLYTDLLREFIRNDYYVYLVSPVEKKEKIKTHIIKEQRCELLQIKVGNYFNVGLFEKGITLLAIDHQVISAIKKYWKEVHFDLILYATPPITFSNTIAYFKKINNSTTYLLLKDIFPQNSVDMGMMSKTGIKAPLYHYFRGKERQLYNTSDFIGCMSLANVRYVIDHNHNIEPSRVEVCPNSIEVSDKSVSVDVRKDLRKKYGIPIDSTVYVYGGNLGAPQGIPFLIKCIESQRNNDNVFILVVGDGTEYNRLEKFSKEQCQKNFRLMRRLPKEDYDRMVAACDVGMIFLDHGFTIPNFPGRILSYMQAKIPVLACTDQNTDIGEVIKDGNFGWWCESSSVEGFKKCIEYAMESDKKSLGNNGYKYLIDHYSVAQSYRIIAKHMREID